MNVAQNHTRPASSGFTLVEILISIMILALGVLGLGALFPVIIREQRLGTDASAGVSVSNSARALLMQTKWGGALASQTSGMAHPALGDTQFLWNVLRDPNAAAAPAHYSYPIPKGLGKGWQNGGATFQYYGQGEWYTTVIDTATGTLQLGYPNVTNAALQLSTDGRVWINNTQDRGWVDVPVATRLYPTLGSDPQFVWDVAFQRVTNFDHVHYPGDDPVRAVLFVRRIDPRIRATGNATSITEALLADSSAAEFRFPVGEDPVTENPTFDGTGRYSGIKTCEVDFFYSANASDVRHNRDRLYQPQQWTYGAAPVNLPRLWAQMKQPGQKLVDNLGNVYTVVGSGTESGVGSGEYLKIDPPVPESVTEARSTNGAGEAPGTYGNATYAKRAIRQVAFTPQIPVSVTLVEVSRGSAQ